MQLTLKRNTSDKYGTRGALLVDDAEYCKTLEPEIPVIPAGEYILKDYFSHKRRYTVKLFTDQLDSDFYFRSLEMHIGNVYLETEGCVLVGSGFGVLDFTEDGREDHKGWGILPGLLGSSITFHKIMQDIPDNTPVRILPLEYADAQP